MKQRDVHISLRTLLLLAVAVLFLCSFVSQTSIYPDAGSVHANIDETVAGQDVADHLQKKSIISTDKGKSKLKVRYRAQYHPFTTWGAQVVSTPIVSFYKYVHTALYFLRLSEVLNKSYLRGPPAIFCQKA